MKIDESSPLDFTVSLGTSRHTYRGLRLIARACRVLDMNGPMPHQMFLVARNDHEGPFAFISPPDGVDPFQCACRGMPLVDMNPSAVI